MNTTFFKSIAILSVIIAAGCSTDSGCPQPEPTPPVHEEQKLRININPSVTETKATDYGFESGDCIGLYIVNYSGSTPGTLASTGNHVDNMRFTYSGVWTPDIPVEWANSKTHADFYLYYPYRQVNSVNAFPFSVKPDQSTEENYKASDLMIGKVTDIAPTESAVEIPVSHTMSRIMIYVEAGNGFTGEYLAKANISVRINGVKCNSIVNIATGTAIPTGETTSLTPLSENSCYKALIVPQTVGAGNLITVTVDGRDFNLNRGFTFERAKSHKFVVVLSKTSAGVNVNINPWIEDGNDYGGIAE